MIQEKPWGTSERLLLASDVQIERVRGIAGSASSLHLHLYRHNLFFVLDGCLRIELLSGANQVATLTRGQSLLVPARIPHRMMFIEDSDALEVYYTDGPDVDPDDIRRLAQGVPAPDLAQLRRSQEAFAAGDFSGMEELLKGET